MIDIHRAFVLRKENNEYWLDVISPYEALYSSVFGVQADTLSYSQDGMCRRLFDELIDKLNYREKTVISKLYGYKETRCSREAVAAELETSVDEVDELKERALGRLREPENYRYLEKRWYSTTDIMNIEYELDYRGMLISEIERYLAGQTKNVRYITGILEANHIEIMRVNGSDNDRPSGGKTAPAQENAGLGVVRNFRDISPEDDDTAAGHEFVGKRGIDDALTTLRELKITARPTRQSRRRRRSKNDLAAVVISKSGVEQAYRYSGLTDGDVAGCVFQVLSESYSTYGCILNYNISDGLMGLLLLKGYFYLDNVLADKDSICELLDAADMHELSVELSEFFDKAEVYITDRTHAPLTFEVLPEQVARFVYERNPGNYRELIECFAEADEELSDKLIRSAGRGFAEFSDMKVTEEAENRLADEAG